MGHEPVFGEQTVVSDVEFDKHKTVAIYCVSCNKGRVFKIKRVERLFRFVHCQGQYIQSGLFVPQIRADIVQGLQFLFIAEHGRAVGGLCGFPFPNALGLGLSSGGEILRVTGNGFSDCGLVFPIPDKRLGLYQGNLVFVKAEILAGRIIGENILQRA